MNESEILYVIPVRRGMAGRAYTVERLAGDATTAYGAPEGSVGRLAVIERADGAFVAVRAVADGTADDAKDMALIAEAMTATLAQAAVTS